MIPDMIRISLAHYTTHLRAAGRSPVTTIGYVQQDPARLRKAAAATWVA